MATQNSQFTVRVNVTDGGDVERIKKALAGLGATVTSTGRAARGAGKDAGDFYDTQKKGIIGTANSTKSFSKLAETIGGRSTGLVSAYAELAANTFALTAAFNALRSASQVEQVFRGLEAAGSRTGQALTVSARALREVTGAAIDTEQSLRSTAQIASAGFGQDSIMALGQAARDTSFALGRNMTDSLDRLTRGVVKLEPELLDELGIMTKLTESNTNYAAKLGKTESQLTNFEKRQGFLNAVLAEAQLKFGGLAEEAGDSTAYDKLVASLSDLSTNTISLLNGALKPLANILSESPTALLGVAILLGSTIAGKLLPSLANSVTSAREAAEASKKHAAILKEETVATISNARAQEQANLARIRGATALSSAGPKVYEQMNDKIKQGTALAKDYDAAIMSLQRRIKGDEGTMLRNPKYAPDTAEGAQKAQRIKESQEEIARLQNLKKINEELGSVETRRLSDVRQARLQYVAAVRLAASQEAAAAAIGAASQLSIGAATRETIKSTLKYASSLAAVEQAQREAAGNSVPLFDRLKNSVTETRAAVAGLWIQLNSPQLNGINKARVGIFALGTAAKAAGAAFLTLIPVIGQLTLAASVVGMVIDALKPDSVKKMEKAFEDFNEVVGSTNKSIEELNRTQTSTASLALRTERALIIQSNAISTLVEAYEELTKKQAELGNKSKSGSGVSGIFDTWTGRGFASYLLNIDKSSKALQAFDKDLPSAFKPNGVKNDPVLSGTIETLDKLNKLAPEATSKAIAFSGGWEKFAKLPLDQKVATVGKIASDINTQYKSAAATVSSLVESFKNLNQSIGDFALSQIQSTPYDQVVKGFQASTNGIKDFQAMAARSANVSADSYKGLLSGMGSNIEAFLKVDTKKQLDDFRAINDQIQEIESRRAQGLQIDEESLRKLKSRRDGQAWVLDVINQELAVTQKNFELAQKQDRLLKSQLGILQAHLTANQANYAATASGIKARMEGENKVKQIQISQLEVQKGLIQSYIAQNRAQIDNLKAQIESIKAAYDFNKAIDEGNVMVMQRAAHLREQAAEMRLGNRGESGAQILMSPGMADAARTRLGKDRELVDAYIQAHEKAEALDKLQSNYQGIERGQQAIEGYESSISSLVNQINALAISESTSGQIAAESAAKRAEIINQQTDQLKTQFETLKSIQAMETATNRLLEGRSDTIADQLRDTIEAANAQKVLLKNDNANALRTLNSELAKAMADSAVANDPASKQANRDRVALLQEQIRLETQGYEVALMRVDAETRSAIAQKAAFDTQSTGLQMQQDTLTYVDKQLQARRELVDSVREQSNLEREITRRSRGVQQTSDSRMSDEIMATKAAYDFAVDEANLRRTTIKLEYALLDAQRQTQLNNLQAQRAVLVQTQGANSDMVRQLDATIDGLGRASGMIASAQNDAMKLVDKQIESAYRRLQLAALPEGSRDPSIAQYRKDRQERLALQREVLSGNMRRESATATALEPVISPLVKISADNLEGLKALTSVNERLVTVGLQLADKQKGQESGTNSTLSRISIQDAAKQAIDQGFRVSELKGSGSGVSSGVHRGKGHDAGRAFDMNIGYGNVEANDPAMRARMDKMAEQFRAQGFKVLWKVAGHFNHMHVEMVNTANKAVTAQTQAVVATAQVAERKIETVATAVNDNQEVPGSDIVVTGLREKPQATPEAPIRAPASSEFLDLYSVLMDKDFSISQVFEKMADDLGPQGQIVPAILEGIHSVGNAYLKLKDIFADREATFGDKFQGIATVAQAALGTMQSVLSASAQAKEDAVQREIDAEQRRDGKSAESVAKIAALEKKKDEIARKQFNTNKKIQMAQAVIATAAGIAQALSYGPIVGPIMAGVIGAMGAAQIAIIAGTQYQSTASTVANNVETPTLSIGKRGDTVDLAKQNNNVGGELGYLRGRQGTGSNASNYSVIGSAYGGDLPRGYGNTGYILGEKGPETIFPDTPITVRPANDNANSSPISATINIHALDASGVEDVLREQKGNLISMFREAANANGQPFLEDINTSTYSRPNKTANSRL